jgi:phosphoenolpyruvate carboxylase
MHPSLSFGWPPLHDVLSNAAPPIATSDPEVMAMYAGLAGDAELREAFLVPILEERERTMSMLEEIYGGPLRTRRPNISPTLDLRAPALRLLYDRQIELIREWRATPDDETLLSDLLLTVNASAGGLGSTG